MNTTPTAPAPGRSPHAFFEWVRSLGLVRGSDSWIGGVCSAIAARTGLDPLIVRGVAIVVGILGGPILLAYAAAWALIPDETGRIHAERVIHGQWEPPSIAIAVMAVVTFLPFMRGVWWQGAPDIWGMPDWLQNTLRAGWTIALVGGAVWLTIWLVQRGRAGSRAGDADARQQNPVAQTTSPGAPASPPSYTAASFTPASYSPATDSTLSSAPPSPYAAGSGAAAGSGSPQGPLTEAATAAQGAATAPPSAPSTAPYGSPYSPSGRPDPDRIRAEAERARLEAAAIRAAAQEERIRLRSSVHDQHRQKVAEAKATARSEAEAARQERSARRPGAVFSMITIGLAAVGGGIAASAAAAISAGGSTTGVGSVDATIVAGSAVALAVLALGIVVSGLRGRTDGSLGGFALVLVVVLVITGLLPRGTQVQLFGSPEWVGEPTSRSTVENFAVLAGGPTLDLGSIVADADSSAAGGGQYSVFVGGGKTTVELPADQAVVLELHTLAGAIDYPDDALDRGGVFVTDSRTYGERGARAVATVSIYTGFGLISVVDGTPVGRTNQE